MNTNRRKTAATIWAVGSVGFFIAIICYIIIYQPPAQTDAAKTNYLLDHWFMVSTIWKAETLSVILLTISASYFAISRQRLSWITVAFAHIIMLSMYAFMLGAYPEAAESYSEAPTLFPMLNDTAIWIFGFSNLLFLSGMTGIYYTDTLLPSWLSRIGLAISVIGALSATALFLNLITFAQMNMAGPFILILYLINAYWGFRMSQESEA